MEENNYEMITKSSMEIILEQMTNSVCLINNKKGSYELGFFVNFIYKKEKIKMLITRYDIMDGYNENILNIIFKNENKKIQIGNKRYLNKEYNISIIEIIENKNDNIKFLEIDDNLFNEELEINYYKKSIYLIQYNNKKDISVSFGMIKGIIKSKIIYSCFTNSNSKGLPIFNLSDKKIIGIHGHWLNDNNNKGKLFIKSFVKVISKDKRKLKKMR